MVVVAAAAAGGFGAVTVVFMVDKIDNVTPGPPTTAAVAAAFAAFAATMVDNGIGDGGADMTDVLLLYCTCMEIQTLCAKFKLGGVKCLLAGKKEGRLKGRNVAQEAFLEQY